MQGIFFVFPVAVMMSFPFYIAKRYFFSTKSYNTVHLVSLITVVGIAIATLATVCTLSIFNGFRGLMSELFSTFDPELKITPAIGKVFDPTAKIFLQLYQYPEIETISETLEEQVLLIYQDRQIPIRMKGVSDHFRKLVSWKKILVEGTFQWTKEKNPCSILGIGVANTLCVNTESTFPLNLYVPKRTGNSNDFSNPAVAFSRESVFVSGIFMMHQSVYDDNYILVPIDLARQLLDYPKEVSALEIKLKHSDDISSLKEKIQRILPDDYLVKDRYEQQQAAFNMICIEKWITFLFLCFILMIAAFNLIGSLSILIADKQKDICTFYSLGASKQKIAQIFCWEGWLITNAGCATGIVLGILICFGQQYFGWLSLGNAQGTFIVDTYPVRIETTDILCIALFVLTIGLITVLYPIKYGIKNQ